MSLVSVSLLVLAGWEVGSRWLWGRRWYARLQRPVGWGSERRRIAGLVQREWSIAGPALRRWSTAVVGSRAGTGSTGWWCVAGVGIAVDRTALESPRLFDTSLGMQLPMTPRGLARRSGILGCSSALMSSAGGGYLSSGRAMCMPVLMWSATLRSRSTLGVRCGPWGYSPGQDTLCIRVLLLSLRSRLGSATGSVGRGSRCIGRTH